MIHPSVAIIGCGTAGPSAALFLKKLGFQVEIFEKAPRFEAVGAGFLLQPSGMQVLHHLGLMSEVLKIGDPINRLYSHNQANRTMLDLKYNEVLSGLFGLGIYRPAFLDIFIHALNQAEIPIHLNTEVIDVQNSIESCTLKTSQGIWDKKYDLVLLCDGARSQLRQTLNIHKRCEEYPWGAIWFIGKDDDFEFTDCLYQVVENCKNMIGLLPTGKIPDHPETHYVSLFYSLENSQMKNFFARDLNSFKNEILYYIPKAKKFLEQITHMDQLTFARYFDIMLKPWHKNRIIVLGDSAHATSPQLGQGVNLALCDAWQLYQSLSEHPQFDQAFKHYHKQRRAQLAYYQFTTRLLTPFFQSHSKSLGVLRDLVFPIMNKIPPIRKQMVRTMSGVKRGFFRKSYPYETELFT